MGTAVVFRIRNYSFLVPNLSWLVIYFYFYLPSLCDIETKNAARNHPLGAPKTIDIEPSCLFDLVTVLLISVSNRVYIQLPVFSRLIS